MVHAQRIIDDTLLNHPANTKGGGACEQQTPYLELQEAIRKIILDATVPAFDRRRRIRDLIKKELISPQQGFFCQAADGRAFYFYKPQGWLYDLEQKQFQHLLSSISDLSATESQFRFVLDSFQTEAARTKAVDVHTLSFSDLQTGRLVVSDGAGGVWRRERRGKWKSGHNGDDGLLFLTDSDGNSWTPEFKQDGALAWFLNQLLLDNDPSLTPDQQKTLLTVWLSQNFFPALRRTRVIPAFLGPQGSGKTSAMRMIGSLLCGAHFDVTGLSRDREDAFVAAVSNRGIVGLDNADSRIPWLEDSLATYATGLRYRLRRLYTTNDEVSYSPRAILMLSSRDPHFRRPDVAERLLPLHFQRPQRYQPESALLGGLVERRGRIIGELLLGAGAIADYLGSVTLPALQFRMADFATFGWAVACSAGQEAEWLDLLGKLERGQIEFASEGDSLVMVLRGILESDGVIEPIDVGSLYKKCSALAEGASLPFPKSAQGFGRHLTNMRRVVEIELSAVVNEERGPGTAGM